MLDLRAIEAGIKMIAKEKKISEEKIKEIIESALKTAYKKDYSNNRDEQVNVKLDFETYEIDVNIEKTVVKEVTNPGLEISFDELGDDAENFSEGWYYWTRYDWRGYEGRLRKFWENCFSSC